LGALFNFTLEAISLYFLVFLSMIDSLKMLDRAVLLKINSLHTPFLDTLMYVLSEQLATILTVLIVLSIAFIFYKKFSVKKAAEFLIGCAIVFACTDLSSNAIKHGVKRYRPTHNTEIKELVHMVNNYSGGKYGFFSGHAANTFGTITFIFLCLNWIRPKYKLLLFIYPFVIGYSRMYLGVHYPSDIFVGMVDGLFFGILGYYIMNVYFLKQHVPES
jgi:undecaprenyl-diphosphatase